MARAKKLQDPLPAANPAATSNESNNQSTSPLAPSAAASTTVDRWEVPTGMSKDYSTFINHDSEVNSQGYPLFPNRSTVWVHPVNSPKIQNFKKFRFVHTDNHETKKCQQWKLIRVTCLGVLLCDCEECNYAGPPPTSRDKIMKELLSCPNFCLHKNPTCQGSAGRCPGNVYWHKCTGTKICFDIHTSGWALLRHQGLHNHPWPALKKPNPLALVELASEIKKNPKASALELKIGSTTGPDQPINSVVDIHDSLGNSDWLHYYQRQILALYRELPETKGGNGGNKFLNDIFQWDELSVFNHLVNL
ncbi:hypothetical protein PSTT_15030 [Puccinia striiformis]|uniref:GCM domain-containing protein n=1 Tax=Puccinia striiformis TaxID=27350 RepID=A0A2S4UK04_9BASI|nr:hypothetical protein PSTT_15030 [Puccinia striiformis]